MTSVNAELFHREFDRKNDRANDDDREPDYVAAARERRAEIRRYVADTAGDNVHAQLGAALAMLDGLLNRRGDIDRVMFEDWKRKQGTPL